MEKTGMNICFISPYMPTSFGGGEKYIFDCATALTAKHDVSVGLPIEHAEEHKKAYEAFLGYTLEDVNFIPSPLFTSASTLEKLQWTRQFDVLYYETDGSLFFSLAKKNILHIQVPLRLEKSSMMERLKLKNWQIINTNSSFTKQVIEDSWDVKVDVVHYPMVEVDHVRSFSDLVQHKEKIILSVGRFFRQLHTKRQDVLVDMFIDLTKRHAQAIKGWELVLIGGIEDETYHQEVVRQAKGWPIKILTGLHRAQLLEWYQRASIYWHAAGYNVDQDKHPEKVEHFGISTLEAMAAAGVPVVINKGGQPEVVGPDLSELMWQEKAECVQQTMDLISSPSLLAKYQQQAYHRAQAFNKKEFIQKLNQMIGI